MAEITRKRTGELLRKLFEILQQYPDGLKANAALELLASSVEMTAHEKGVYGEGETSTRRFEKIVRFATIDCVKAGWLVKHKGTWFLTEEGVSAYAKFSDPEIFYREAARLYQEWHAKNKGTPVKAASEKNIEEETVEENSSITFEQAEEQAWLQIEKHLKTMNPFDFQELVAGLLHGMGYYVSWVSPPGKDGGVDIIAHPDPLGTQSPRIKVQVKRHADMREGTSNTIRCMEKVLLKLVSGYLFKKQPEKTKEFEEYLDRLQAGYLPIIWDLYNSHDGCGHSCGSVNHLSHVGAYATLIEDIIKQAFVQIYEYGLSDGHLEPRFLIDADPARAKTRK